MSDNDEEPHFTSIKERIALLKFKEQEQKPPAQPAPAKRTFVPQTIPAPPPPIARTPSSRSDDAPPPPPTRTAPTKKPTQKVTMASANLRPSVVYRRPQGANEDEDGDTAAPPMPPRRPSSTKSPALPNRGLPQMENGMVASPAPVIPHRSPPIPSSSTIAPPALPRRKSTVEEAPPLPRRTSTTSQEDTRRPPPLPASARPPVPSSSRPPLPGRAPSIVSPPLPPRELPSTGSVGLDEEPEDEEIPPISVAARAAALSGRLPSSFGGSTSASRPSKASPDPESGKPPVPSGRPPVPSNGMPPIPTSKPPPVPLASRPKGSSSNGLANGHSDSPQPVAPEVTVTPLGPFDYESAPQGSACLVCRDFSGPDMVAAQYPVASLSRDDTIGYLASALCAPFQSATDMARAIFTWCHHNIEYDADGFFNNRIPRGQTTEQTIFSGKAVCEGYAKVYASIAERAGLECVTISGHGKGYGFTTFQPGDPVPSDITGHAWNAVRIDGGEWHLVDACWGAGAISTGTYEKRFAPEHFHLSNEDFGLRHYPADVHNLFRTDGLEPSWEEYLIGPLNGWEAPEWYLTGDEEGFSKRQLQPATRSVDLGSAEGGYIRFMAARVCEHWDGAVNGPGPAYPIILSITAGGKNELKAMETDGYWYWLDVPAAELGARSSGVQVFLSAVTMIDGQSARGKGEAYFTQSKGRKSMSFTHIAYWDIA